MSFFATAMGGLEPFCAEEVREKLTNVRDVTHIQGRVFWKSDDFSPNVLRSCERIFRKCSFQTHSTLEVEEAKQLLIEDAEKVNWGNMISSESGKAVSFRVQARIRGSLKRKLNFQEVKKLYAKVILATEGRNFTYEEDREKADVEIFVHWNDERLIVGIPLGNSKRDYMPNPGIRCTLAWAMAHLAKVRPGQIVIDPCVGKGTTIFECVMSFVDVSVIGVDTSEDTMKECAENQNSLPDAKRARTSIFQADARSLPIKSSSIDVAICDPPFGILHKVPNQDQNKHSLSQFYSDLLSEMYRILTDEAVCVFLISNVTFLEHSMWDMYKVHPVRHGRLNASLVLLKKAQHVRKKRKVDRF